MVEPRYIFNLPFYHFFVYIADRSNILFTVRPGVNPTTVLAELNEIRKGTSTDLNWQNSGENTYLNLGEYLRNISKSK
ncbi:MAG: hypothetical protein EWV82_19580 [Microcystis aeruginosa Ma_AC_P_19900807_S299]|nr:MAG: hypothetical protein EWV82_19580 [Microcystis aeruginosa Ma_AC_P_19900807_S299]